MKKKCLIFFTIGIGDSLMVTPVIERLKSSPDMKFADLKRACKRYYAEFGQFRKSTFLKLSERRFDGMLKGNRRCKKRKI